MVDRYSLVSLLAATAFVPLSALAEYKCDNPTHQIDKRACAKAAEGPDALRRFVERTRMIWQLDIWDYSKPEASRPTSEGTPRTLLAVQSEPRQAEPSREAAPTP
jgi:hypothetical protein